MDARKFKAQLKKARTYRLQVIERYLEREDDKRQAREKKRELRKQQKRRIKTRAGRLGATLHEDFSQAQLDKRIRFLGSQCIYCNGPFQHLDHLVPISCGGRHALWNLAPSCRACNGSKRDSDPLDWVARKAINKTAVVLVEKAVKRHMRRANA